MRLFAAAFAALLPSFVQAVQILEVPEISGVDLGELDRHAQAAFDTRMAAAAAARQLGCRRHCENLGRIFARVTAAAASQGALAAPARWQLAVVSGGAEDAYALPDGHIVISEAFIDRLHLTDDEIAFVLAHEAAHVVLQHDRWMLSVVQAIAMPRGISRSVGDLYAELDFDLGTLLSLSPLLRQSEFDADYGGMVIGALAGFSPEGMVGFMAKLAAEEGHDGGVIESHPDSLRRLERLRALLGFAHRIQELAPSAGGRR